jgi:hypothetical protein
LGGSLQVTSSSSFQNFTAGNATLTQATTTDFYSDILTALSGFFTNLTTTNFLATNSTTTNATTTNLSTTNLTATKSFLSYSSSTALTVTGNSYLSTITSGTWNGEKIGIAYGGTGTTTAPSFGKILMGNSSGTYDLVATSSLGVSSETGLAGQVAFYGNDGSIVSGSPLLGLSVASSSIKMGTGVEANGLYSVAMGYYSTAAGYASAAFGHNNYAGGGSSVAMGYDTNATGNYSFTVGKGTRPVEILA